MHNISILHCTAEQYQSQIIQLWTECLPGTPKERFNWLAQGNPAGPTEWFLAITDQGELVATSSVMPKDLFFNGRKIRGGVVGDIMTAPAVQHRGVARQIQKKITDSLAELAMEFLCVVPNKKSRPLFSENCGWKKFRLRNYLFPVDFGYYLKKCGIPCLQEAGSIMGDFLSGNRYNADSNNFCVDNVENALNQEIEKLWQSVIDTQGLLVGIKSISYLHWKYCTFQHTHYKLLKYRISSGSLNGFCIFTVESGKVHIFELLCTRLEDYRLLLTALVSWARMNRCVGVYLYTVRHNPALDKIRKYNWLRIGGDMDLFCYGNVFKQSPPWLYFAGDRNI